MNKRAQAQDRKRLSRRSFLALSSAATVARLPGKSVAEAAPARSPSVKLPTSGPPSAERDAALRDFLSQATCRREEVEVFLDPRKPNWAKFDPEFGYTLRDNILKDGMDGSREMMSFLPTGERTIVNYAQRPCRINTYGNSFTQCAQVSDGETWQEYLAAHLGEPIRNFGIGGYGVYQAYRRMLREEHGPRAAEYLILNIWGPDDHFRSMDAWRWFRMFKWFRTAYPGHLFMFHANPWVYARLDPHTGGLVEMENAFNTPESLYKLTDAEFVYKHFKDDLVVKLLIAERNGALADRDALEALAKLVNVKADFSSPQAAAATAGAVHLQYALRTGMHIVEKAQAFAHAKNRKLLVLLSYDSGTVTHACQGQPRPDQVLVDFLKEKDVPFVDTLAGHIQDFQAFRLSAQEYVKRYYIGHYNPRGNHFFAFAVKDALVKWLNPAPLAYREGAETIPAVI
jgi:hypothetical protein